jgi:hypothetical protein
VLAQKKHDAALMKQALTHMQDAAEFYRRNNITAWLPSAEASIDKMQAELAEMQARYNQ